MCEIKVSDLQNTFSVGVLFEDKVCGFVPKAETIITLRVKRE